MGEGKKGTFLMGFGLILCLLFWRGGGGVWMEESYALVGIYLYIN